MSKTKTTRTRVEVAKPGASTKQKQTKQPVVPPMKPKVKARAAAKLRRGNVKKVKAKPVNDLRKGLNQSVELRKLEAFELRAKGNTYQAIGHLLGVSTKTAHQYVHEAWGALREVAVEEAEMLRQIEARKLDAMEAKWLAIATSDKLALMDMKDPDSGAVVSVVDAEAVKVGAGAVSAVLRIMERRAKLAGLDAAVEVRDNTPKETAEDRARAFATVFNPILGKVIAGQLVDGAEPLE